MSGENPEFEAAIQEQTEAIAEHRAALEAAQQDKTNTGELPVGDPKAVAAAKRMQDISKARERVENANKRLKQLGQE